MYNLHQTNDTFFKTPPKSHDMYAMSYVWLMFKIKRKKQYNEIIKQIHSQNRKKNTKYLRNS